MEIGQFYTYSVGKSKYGFFCLSQTSDNLFYGLVYFKKDVLNAWGKNGVHMHIDEHLLKADSFDKSDNLPDSLVDLIEVLKNSKYILEEV